MASSSHKIDVLPLGRTVLGEGPHWDSTAQELLYVDIYGKSVHRYNPVTGQERIVVIDEAGEQAAISFVIPVQSQSDKYLIAYNGDVSVLEWPGDTGVAVQKVSPKMLRVVHSAPAHNPPTTMNDAKCDSKGRLWTGTLCVQFKGSSLREWELVKGVCHLFRLDTDGQSSTHLDGLDLSNGLAWSADGKRFYFNDSGTCRVDVFDYDLVKGTINNRRPAFDFKANNLEGFPDGMCIDANDNLWVAAYGTGIINVDPRTGKLLRTIEFPGNKKITSCAFGGRDLDELYVTSANFELSEEEIAASGPKGPGAVYKVTGLGVKGPSSGGIAYGGKV